MKIDNFGSVFLSEKETFDALYAGKLLNLDKINLDQSTINQFNIAIDKNRDSFNKLKLDTILCSQQEFDNNNRSIWFMPDNYCPNLIEFLYNQCTTEEQKNRVNQELELFIQHNLIDVLFYLKYLVDTMRDNKIIWGVGRGSSVSSYVLFLIGIHKVDSLKYDLDIKEFFK